MRFVRLLRRPSLLRPRSEAALSPLFVLLPPLPKSPRPPVDAQARIGSVQGGVSVSLSAVPLLRLRECHPHQAPTISVAGPLLDQAQGHRCVGTHEDAVADGERVEAVVRRGCGGGVGGADDSNQPRLTPALVNPVPPDGVAVGAGLVAVATAGVGILEGLSQGDHCGAVREMVSHDHQS